MFYWQHVKELGLYSRTSYDIVGFRLVEECIPEYKIIRQLELNLRRGIISYLGLVEMAISTNPKPTIYRNLYENADPAA